MSDATVHHLPVRLAAAIPGAVDEIRAHAVAELRRKAALDTDAPNLRDAVRDPRVALTIAADQIRRLEAANARLDRANRVLRDLVLHVEATTAPYAGVPGPLGELADQITRMIRPGHPSGGSAA